MNLQHGPLQGERVTDLLGAGPQHQLIHQVSRLVSTSEQGPLPGRQAAAVVPSLDITTWTHREDTDHLTNVIGL